MPQAERVPQRGDVIGFTETMQPQPIARRKDPSTFYGVRPDDPAQGFSPSVPPGGLTASFVGRVLSREDDTGFSKIVGQMAAAYEANPGTTWTSNFFQGVLMEVERRYGTKPAQGDLSFAAGAGRNSFYVGKKLDYEFMANYCD
jgi:hypothetical protein